MTDFWQRLKQRKIVQWAIAYVAFAFALIQALGAIAGSYHWPDAVMHIAFGVLTIGFVVVLVLAWYHGERGAQRLSGGELLIVALLLAIGGGLIWHFARAPASSPAPVARMARSYNTVDCRSGPCPRPAAKSQDRSPSEEQAGTLPTEAASEKAPAASALAAQPIPAKSIAVLPFVNLSGDAGKAYFSDGITEEILNALAQIPGLKVAARTSAFAFKGKAENLHRVGEVLGVATVLEGSVQTAGDDVRITAQLIDVRSGYQLWSQKYDRKLTNIFAVEDEISKAIADKLQVSLSGAGGQPLATQKTVDPRAHDFYLRGLTLLAARSLRDAVNAFQQAVKLDPAYAQAWGALAESEVLLPDSQVESATAALPRAESAAQRALALDPDTASAYVALGVVHEARWQWSAADQAFRRALAVAPGDAEALDQYAQFLSAVGQFEPALREIERAQQLDPLSAVIGTIRAGILVALDRDGAAEAQIQRTLAAHPDFGLAHTIAAMLAARRHDYAESETQSRIAARLAGRDPKTMARLVQAKADPSLRAATLKSLETSPAYAGLRRNPIVYASFLMRLGAHARALAALESNGVHTRSMQTNLLWSSTFDPVRNDPRFKAVLKKMGLPYKPPLVPPK